MEISKCYSHTKKRENKALLNNYRPISLTSVVDKLVETKIRDKLVSFLEENFLFEITPHDFCHKCSRLTNLLDFYNDVFNNYVETKAVNIIYLDFQKVYDKVPHKRILKKFQSHGIADKRLSWLEDWLSERKHCIVINGKTSN